MVIDSHLHLPVISENNPYLKALELLLEDMEKDLINYAILIPDNVINSPIGDVDTCLELIKKNPELFLLGTIDIRTQGKTWIDKLERLLIDRKIVGIKIFPGHDPIYPTDTRLDAIYELCQSLKVPMVIHTGWNSGHPEVAKYNDPKYIVQVAEKYPDLKIVIAHFFWPNITYCYEITHIIPHIYYDTSGMADEEVIRATGMAQIQQVLTSISNENPEKIIFGTDYAMCNRSSHIKLIKQLPISREIQEMIFWRNAINVFNLPIINK